jgi:hypothetical protein
MQRISLWIALALAAICAQAGDVYKWTDAGGVVHYSDTEPSPDMKARKLRLDGTKPREVASAAANDADEPAAAATTTKAAAETLIGAARVVDRHCEQARAELELLQGPSPVGIDQSGTGKPEPLDDRARQSQIARVQTTIATYCK